MKKQTVISLLAFASVAAFSATSCVDPQYSATAPAYKTGDRIDTLPKGYRTEILDGTTYYYYDGYYYLPDRDAYVVAKAPRRSRYYKDYSRHLHNRDLRGDSLTTDTGSDVQLITRLPKDTRVIDHEGVRYYRHHDQFYRREGNGFITVSAPF